MGVITWGPLAAGWLSGKWRAGSENPGSSRAYRVPARFDMSLPENQRKLAAAEALARLAEDGGMSLIHMAVAFVRQHPAVTAPIIGPRTADQYASYLGALDVSLEPAVLDRIDEIVTPGTNVSWHDAGLVPPSIAEPSNRRNGQP
jgi:aryl-alcohol dehydrogenase-like predicted oxidoreductase